MSKLKNKFDKSVSLLCWAYNEEQSIYGFLQKASLLMDSAVDNYEIVLIDDGSTDNTYKIAKAFQGQNPNLKIYRNYENLNVGYSCRKAIQNASNEYLFWQTIDWCYDISNLRVFLEYLKTYDIVQGVRIRPVMVKFRYIKPLKGLFKLFGIKHLTKRSDTVLKAIISVVNYIFIRVLFMIPLSDFQNVTFYPTCLAQSITYEARSSFANPEGLIKSFWRGMSIKEVPINFIPRKKGRAKGARPRAIMNSVNDIFRLWFKWVFSGKYQLTKKGRISRYDPAEWQEKYESVIVDSTDRSYKILR